MGSARVIARLTQEQDAYRCICGGVGVNYHTLSDLRTAHGEALDGLLSESVALVLVEGVVTLKRVAQDGVRVRAGAGAASFRRAASLTACLQEAHTQVERLRQQTDSDPGADGAGIGDPSQPPCHDHVVGVTLAAICQRLIGHRFTNTGPTRGFTLWGAAPDRHPAPSSCAPCPDAPRIGDRA